MGEMILDNPARLNLIMRVPVRGRQGSEKRPCDNRSWRKQSQKEKMLALRVEGGTMSRGIQAASLS